MASGTRRQLDTDVAEQLALLQGEVARLAVAALAAVLLVKRLLDPHQPGLLEDGLLFCLPCVLLLLPPLQSGRVLLCQSLAFGREPCRVLFLVLPFPLYRRLASLFVLLQLDEAGGGALCVAAEEGAVVVAAGVEDIGHTAAAAGSPAQTELSTAHEKLERGRRGHLGWLGMLA